MTITPTIALVTGASRGLGKSTALKLAERGSDIILTDHSIAEQAQHVVGQIERLGRRAVALRLDVSDSKSFPGSPPTCAPRSLRAGRASGSTIWSTTQAPVRMLRSMPWSGST